MQILNKVKKNYLEYPVEITAVALCAIGYVLYVSLYYSVEVLYLASFYGDVQIVDKLLNGTLVFKDLIRRFGEHGMLGYDILLLINAVLFKYTSRFDLVVNSINVFICGVVIVYCIQKSVTSKNIFYYIGIVIVSIVMFSTVQGSSSSMDTQVRLGLMFYLLGAYFVSMVMTKNVTGNTLIAAIALIFVGINVFGTFYSFAGVPMVFLLMLIFSIRSKKIDTNYSILAVTYIISIVIYLSIYDITDASTSKRIGSGSIIAGAIFWIASPIELLKSIFAYNGSAVLGYASFVDKAVSPMTYLSIGILVTCLYAYSVILFIRSKMYEKTVLPALLHSYSFFVLILAIIGRYQYADWSWGTNIWYHVHTKLGLAASIWIIMYALSKEKHTTISSKLPFRFNTAVALAAFLLLSSGLFIGIKADMARAPHVRSWHQNIANYMHLDISDMPIDKDGKTPLFADRTITQHCLNILRKYKLSVFRDPPAVFKASSELSLKNKLLLGNYYNDGWISNKIIAKLNTNSGGHLFGKILLPNEKLIPNAITVYVDGSKVYHRKLTSVGDHSFAVNYEKNKEVIVKIVMDRSIVPKELGLSEDQRELAAILKEFYFE